MYSGRDLDREICLAVNRATDSRSTLPKALHSFHRVSRVHGPSSSSPVEQINGEKNGTHYSTWKKQVFTWETGKKFEDRGRVILNGSC